MKPLVEEIVSAALVKFWKPITETIGINDIVINDIDDRKCLIDEAMHFDSERWMHLVDVFEDEVGGRAKIRSTSQELHVSLEGVKHFSISFSRESLDNDDGFDYSELDGMSREEAIEYLNELDEIPSVEFVKIEIYTGNHFLQRIIGADESVEDFHGIISPIISGLLKTQEIYNDAIKAASIELQQEAEKQREIDNRKMEQKAEKERLLAEFAEKVEQELHVTGWSGKYRVSMNFNNYVLSLWLTSYDECSYESATQSDVISKIGELVNFANAYKTLKIAGGIPVIHGNQVRTADWKTIDKSN